MKFECANQVEMLKFHCDTYLNFVKKKIWVKSPMSNKYDYFTFHFDNETRTCDIQHIYLTDC